MVLLILDEDSYSISGVVIELELVFYRVNYNLRSKYQYQRCYECILLEFSVYRIKQHDFMNINYL